MILYANTPASYPTYQYAYSDAETEEQILQAAIYRSQAARATNPVGYNTASDLLKALTETWKPVVWERLNRLAVPTVSLDEVPDRDQDGWADFMNRIESEQRLG